MAHFTGLGSTFGNVEEEQQQQPLVTQGKAVAIDGAPIELQATTWTTSGDGEGGPAVNLLMSHACGFCKDTLMPLASEIAERVPAVKRGSAVAFDYRGHGQSGPLLKETFETFAKDPSLIWNFPAEDVKAVCSSGVLQRVGSSQPQRPLLVGVGHSMGGNGLVKALLDYTKDEVPLDALVVFEPILNLQSDAEYTGVGPAVGEGMAAGARKRKNEFPSRLEAKEKFGQKPPYGLWDKRALDGFCKTGLRPRDLFNAEAGAGVPFPGRSWPVSPTNKKLSASPTEANAEGPLVLSCHPEFEAVMYSSTQQPLTSRLPQLVQEKELPILIITGTESQMFEPPRREAYGLPAEGAANFGEELRARLLAGNKDQDDEEDDSIPMGYRRFPARATQQQGEGRTNVVPMQGLTNMHVSPWDSPIQAETSALDAGRAKQQNDDEEDDSIPMGYRRFLKQKKCGGRVDVVQMQGLSHLGPMERPGAVAEVVAKWMEANVLPGQATKKATSWSSNHARL